MCNTCDTLRRRIEEIRADYPSDVFPGDIGKGARMAIDRVLMLFALEQSAEPFDPYGYLSTHLDPESTYWDAEQNEQGAAIAAILAGEYDAYVAQRTKSKDDDEAAALLEQELKAAATLGREARRHG